MKTVIIGGGPAGIMAAISAKENHPEDEVVILEKNNTLGRKLLITGKGRCNITSSLNIDEFIKNIPGNGMFMFSAFKNYTNTDIINLLQKNGVETKEERGNRVFPLSDKSRDVLEALERELKRLNVIIKLNCEVKKINKIENTFFVDTNIDQIKADKLIIATGGKSYPLTGSTGDGYLFAKWFGHTITDIEPSLVPLEIRENNECKNMQGLSLRNVSIKIKDIENNKQIYEDFGEMLFTHFGISGPIILSSSAHLIRYKNIESLLKNGKIKIYIDLKPALSVEQLNLRILRDFEKEKNKEFRNSLFELLPRKIIDYIISQSKINPCKKVNEITKQERLELVKQIKQVEFTIKGTRPIEEGIITSGGINIKEINPSTMESKLVKGLYFAGEVIDVDAYTGGFNLQIAYSTGYTAGK
jgi:predicted Rossmann fold flavoprotein